MEAWNKIKQFLTKVVQSDSKESHKRLLAVLCWLVPAISTFIYATEYNLLGVITVWISAMLTLAGFSVWEKIKGNENNK